ncbi:hypothetical protein [Solidesulfovibrio magneticus]|uniref:Uncharacterized protein n=1 Tax=Solidesulfovibrio magneticus (strain ATCC 700980 / DSM 13731 / RS-1) TaxID=573370 RepID=C4XPS0_SOLM1|nr:hypothetical protein [Solidesulfovibrio magneticus]BAH77620.1 hypothetical protein DMR_41290 [Solidesulfovibrio magneticus RS-1]
MWIFTTDGFFSIVKSRHCSEDELAVRAQSRADLERLLGKLGARAEIIEHGDSEYAFRAILPQQALAAYLAQTADSLDYANFKTEATGVEPCRAPALQAVWKLVMDRWGAWE